MSTNPCNTTALTNLLSSLNGSSSNALSEIATVSDVMREARSVAVASNTNNYGTVAAGSTVTGAMIQGLRNRLFLKYSGIDYEFYNVYDLQYRTTA